MDIGSWQSQLRKGAAELVLLSVLSRGEAYGLEILARIRAGGDLVSEGSLYPLLARLEKAGRIAGRWELPAEGGNPRKYYSLTLEGAALAEAMRAPWIDFRTTITTLGRIDIHRSQIMAAARWTKPVKWMMRRS